MKKQIKIILIAMLTCLAACFLYIHRRVIKALIKGEPLPELPEGHPFHASLAKKCAAPEKPENTEKPQSGDQPQSPSHEDMENVSEEVDGEHAENTGSVSETIGEDDKKVLLTAQQGELDAVLMYKALADTISDPEDAAVFKQLAAEEGGHAAVFKNLTGTVLKPKKTKAILLPFLYRTLGKAKVYPLIAKGEYDAAAKYEPVAAKYPEVESIKADETRHGKTVENLL